MRPTPTRLRDIVFGTLTEIYDADNKGREWYSAKPTFAAEVNRTLTANILSYLADVLMMPEDRNSDYYRRTLHLEVQNMIWMVWPGGSTAEYAADLIWERMEFKEEQE